ncbi:MAG: methyltransferase domain-containing protein [Pseudomonadales bacterium]|nr:methyltransferase domain-containing protein [Pseudomonadales bacterium]
MDIDNFYKDHWQEIENDRHQRYQTMFQWRPEQEVLLAPLDLSNGMTVVDFGCGPGFLAMEMARKVAETGKVYGLDLNARFVSEANDKAKSDGLKQMEFICLKSESIPLETDSIDRLFCKNVLEYVPDALSTLQEHHRILKTGGKIQILDSDWGFVIVEPWGKNTTDDFFNAAAAAFKEPHIGRKLPALLNKAGFKNIDIKLAPFIDRKGHSLNVLTNMVSYIDTFKSKDKSEVNTLMGDIDKAIANGDYLFILPQFVITAVK